MFARKMELLHIKPEYEDDSKIYWNYYFSKLLAWSLGAQHKEIDLEVTELRGPQHKTQIDYVRGVLLAPSYSVIIIHDENCLAIEQQRNLASGLRALLDVLGKQPGVDVNMVAFEEGGNYTALEYFSKN